MRLTAPVLLALLSVFCCQVFAKTTYLDKRELDFLRKFLRSYERRFLSSSMSPAMDTSSTTPWSSTGAATSSATSALSTSSAAAWSTAGSSAAYSTSSTYMPSTASSTLSTSSTYWPSTASSSQPSTSSIISPTSASSQPSASSTQWPTAAPSTVQPTAAPTTPDSLQPEELHSALTGMLLDASENMSLEDYLFFLADTTCIIADLVQTEKEIDGSESEDSADIEDMADSSAVSSDIDRADVRRNRGAAGRGRQSRRSRDHVRFLNALCEALDDTMPMNLRLLAGVLEDFLVTEKSADRAD